MKNILKKILQNDFLSNTFVGIFIRGISFVVPYLLINPYLIRTLGEGQFGLISFSVGFVSLFFPFVEYGFMLTAPRDLALHQNNQATIGEIISNVLGVKILLGSICVFILLGLIFFEKKLASNAILHCFSLTLLLVQILIPSWLYQGLGSLRKFAIYTLLVNILFLLLIFSLIRSSSDYLYVNLIQGLVGISIYLIALLQIMLPLWQYLRFSWKKIILELKKGFFIFLTNLLHFLFIASNIVVLGFFVEGKDLDNYSYAEKIYMIFRIISGVIYQMAYPKAFTLKQTSYELANTFLKKLFMGIFVSFGLVSSVLFWQSESIIYIFTGKFNSDATELLRILAFSSLVYALSVPISQKILVFYSSKVFSVILLAVVIFNISSNLYAIPLYGAKGTATTLLLTEIFFLTLSASYIFIAKKIYK